MKAADGTAVGQIDLLTGAVVITVPEFDSEIRALAAHQQSTTRPTASPSIAPAPPTRDMPIELEVAQPILQPIKTSLPTPANYDLADNLAGAAARAKRQEVNAQAPVWNLVARAFGVKTDEWSWRIGAKGEEKVGRELTKLPDGWHVLHAVPIGDRDSDIDHIVIGPRGVFTLNTKNHPDGAVSVYERAIWVNGHSTDHLRNSRFEAKRVTKLLTVACAIPVEAQATIVFVDPSKLTRKGNPPDVHVTTRKTLRTFLMQQPQRLTPSQVAHVFAVARNSSAWQPT